MLSERSFLTWWGNIHHLISKSESLDNLITLITHEALLMGFNFYSIIIKHAVPFTQTQIDIIGNYPDEWVQKYKNENYFFRDLIHSCREKIQHILEWNDIFKDESDAFYLELKEIENTYGFSQSLLGMDGSVRLYSFSGKPPKENIDYDLLKLKLNCINGLTNAKINEFECKSEKSNKIKISEKEKEILKWTADGKNASEIGTILNITESTVNFHIRNIIKKFNTSNKTFAVAYAVACRLLD